MKYGYEKEDTMKCQSCSEYVYEAVNLAKHKIDSKKGQWEDWDEPSDEAWDRWGYTWQDLNSGAWEYKTPWEDAL